MFDPGQPDVIRLVGTPRELFQAQQAGFKHVKGSRIGQVLHSTRSQLGLDLQGMSAFLQQRACDVKPHTVRALEEGHLPSNVTVPVIKKIAAALQISVGELIYKYSRLNNPLRTQSVESLKGGLWVFHVKAHNENRIFHAHCIARNEEDATLIFLAKAKKSFNATKILIDAVTRVTRKGCFHLFSEAPGVPAKDPIT